MELVLMILENYAASGTEIFVHRGINIDDICHKLRFK